jgi:AmmeMemoRadiSam system protein B
MQKKYQWIGHFLPPLVVIGGFFAVRSMVQESPFDRHDQKSVQGDKRVLRSYYNNISLYTSACENGRLQTSHVIAGITSHHFLAQGLITNFFCGIENIPRHVIIVSPDHFNRFHDQKTIAYVASLSWDTPFGAVSNDDMFERISDVRGVEVNDTLFLTEHGVYTLVPFVAKYFPGAEITSLVVNAKADQKMLSALGKEMRDMDDDNTILIVSSDFSHHGDRQTTLLRDQKSLDLLAHFSSETVNNIVCDCPSCMVILGGYVNDDRAFVVRDHKNSTDYGGVDTDITSYVSGYFVSRDSFKK